MMPAAIKAIVFKTARLKESRAFFENILKLPIKESSVRHFVIHSRGLRIVFVASQNDFEVEIYLNKESGEHTDGTQSELNPHFESLKDPNGINVITA